MRRVFILVLLMGMGGVRLLAGDVADEGLKYWGQWRGPTWNGVAPEGDPPVTWSAAENLKWKSAIAGLGHGTPVIWGDRIFLLTAIALDKKMPVPDVIPPGTPNVKISRTESVGLFCQALLGKEPPKGFNIADHRQ